MASVRCVIGNPHDDGFDQATFNRRVREDEKRWREDQKRNKDDLHAAGVRLVSAATCRRDAGRIIGMILPDIIIPGVPLDASRVSISYQPLTKTGKIPKNVVKASVDAVDLATHDGVISNLKYGPGRKLNSISINIWHSHRCIHVYMRRMDEGLMITRIESSDLQDGRRVRRFDEPHPDGNDMQISLVDSLTSSFLML